MHPDHLLQSDFPTYGHCSIGQPAEEATLVPLKVRQLRKKILKTSQGSMAAFVCGTYAGRHPHQKYSVTHPDEAQILCGKFGIAKGPHNALVARSEHTTISAVILTYQHHWEVPLPDDRSTSFGSVGSSSYLSWLHSVRKKRPLRSLWNYGITTLLVVDETMTTWQKTSTTTWSCCESPKLWYSPDVFTAEVVFQKRFWGCG